ncbi:hypothetical protein NBRC116601_20600 [Cognatishimia sp. WU-CL00825]
MIFLSVHERVAWPPNGQGAGQIQPMTWARAAPERPRRTGAKWGGDAPHGVRERFRGETVAVGPYGGFILGYLYNLYVSAPETYDSQGEFEALGGLCG